MGFRGPAFIQWCLAHPKNIIHSTYHNEHVHEMTGQQTVTATIRHRRLLYPGHVVTVDPGFDTQRALLGASDKFPADWKRPVGHPCRTWPHTIKSDLKQCKTDLHSSCADSPHMLMMMIVNTQSISLSIVYLSFNKFFIKPALTQLIRMAIINPELST